MSFKQLDFKSSLELADPVVKADELLSTGCKIYTVKPNDTLWSISARELSSGSRHTEIIDLNKNEYPSLQTSDKLVPGWELKIDCGAAETPSQEASPTSNSESLGGYVVNIKVMDKTQRPVEGAKVTIHSKIQEATTDENGVARFENVESGHHRVLIAYNNFEGEQSLNVSGDAKELNLHITIKQKNVLTSPLVMMVIGVLSLVIIILSALLFRAKSKRV